MDTEEKAAEEAEPFRYRLADSAIARRAIFGAVAETVSATAPPLFVLLVLGRLAVAPPQYLAAGGALLVVLALARAWTTQKRLKRHLKQFVVEVGPLDVVIGTLRGEHRVPRPAIERIREIPGVLGGLRLDLAQGWDGKDDSPEIVDVPRGGDGFSELRTALEDIRPLEAPKRGRRELRIVLFVVVIVSIFFVPFILDMIGGQSRLIALAVVLAVWVGMRILLRPR
ncbi:MAG TPA: hypothetical protein VF316_10365 [Polyangiaceae bacterium]